LAAYSQGGKKGRNSKLANKVHKGNKCARNLVLSLRTGTSSHPGIKKHQSQGKVFFLIKKNQVLCGYQKSHPTPSNRLSGRLFGTAATVVPLPSLQELNSFLIKLSVKSGD
jgi:hypothetical protein